MSEGNGYAGRDELIQCAGRVYRDVEVPGVGKFRIRSSNVHEYTAIEVGLQREKGSDVEKAARFKSRLIAAHLVDGEGRLLFADTADDLELIGQLPHRIVQALGDAILELSSVTDQSVELAEKN